MTTYFREGKWYRRCKLCGRELPLAMFVKNKSKPGGRDYLCKPCKSVRQSVYSMRLLDDMREDPGHPRHGTYRGYSAGCRCDRCRAEGSRVNRAQRERKKALCASKS